MNRWFPFFVLFRIPLSGGEGRSPVGLKQPDGFGCFAYVVHAQNRCPPLQGFPVQHRSAVQRFGRGALQGSPDHALAREAGQYRKTEHREPVECCEQFEVLIHALGKTEPGVEYQIADSGFAEDGTPSRESRGI